MSAGAVEEVKRYRLAVITSDAGMAANVGGAVTTYVRTFDLPPEVEAYIASQMGTYSHVTFGLERKPYELPPGVPGECACGRVSPRLLNGMCGACRDEMRVE